MSDLDMDELDVPEMYRIVGRIPDVASASSVVGPPQEREGKVAIPLATVSAAYGLGRAEGRSAGSQPDSNEGGGGGGGRATARPVAVLEINDDEVKVHQVVDSTRITLASLALGAWSVFWVMRTIRAFRRP